MIGILDVGGGFRGVYPAGLYDYLTDKKIKFDYYMGVSAGCGNLMSYITGQRGRNLEYYINYSFRKEYMSIGNFIKTGSFLDLNYIYTTMCIRGGENPIDFEAFKKNAPNYTLVATDAKTGKPRYFTKNELHQDYYDPMKASCCIPGVCRPIYIDNKYYYDGGVSAPIPYKKAFNDGCDKLVIVLTRPINVPHEPLKNPWIFKLLTRKFPVTYEILKNKHNVYNSQLKEIINLEKQGLVKIIAPKNTYTVNTLSRNKDAMMKLYKHGFEDGKIVENYLHNI